MNDNKKFYLCVAWWTSLLITQTDIIIKSISALMKLVEFVFSNLCKVSHMIMGRLSQFNGLGDMYQANYA